MNAPTSTSTLFERIGGPGGAAAAVSVFYQRVIADPMLAPWFEGVDMDRLATHQRWFLAAALGGPDRFTGRDLGTAHHGLGITDAAFDRVAEHLTAALTEVGVEHGDVTTIIATVAELRAAVVEARAVTSG